MNVIPIHAQGGLRETRSTCPYCGVGCQLELHVKGEQIIRVTGVEGAKPNDGHLCVKGRYGYDYIHHPERLLKPRVRRYLIDGQDKSLIRPLITGSDKPTGDAWDWVETSWETALNITAKKLSQVRKEHGPDSIGVLTSAKCTNEENYLMNKLARQVIGTNNIDHCARL